LYHEAKANPNIFELSSLTTRWYLSWALRVLACALIDICVWVHVGFLVLVFTYSMDVFLYSNNLTIMTPLFSSMHSSNLIRNRQNMGNRTKAKKIKAMKYSIKNGMKLIVSTQSPLLLSSFHNLILCLLSNSTCNHLINKFTP